MKYITRTRSRTRKVYTFGRTDGSVYTKDTATPDMPWDNLLEIKFAGKERVQYRMPLDQFFAEAEETILS